MGKKSFFSILLAIMGLIASGFIGYSAVEENQRSKQIEGEINALKEEAEKLRQNNQEMQEKIVYFETPEFQEKIAKDKLNLQKGNENVAIIKPTPLPKESETDNPGVIENDTKTEDKPNYQKWMDYFFK